MTGRDALTLAGKHMKLFKQAATPLDPHLPERSTWTANLPAAATGEGVDVVITVKVSEPKP